MSGIGNALNNTITGTDIGNALRGGDGNDDINGGAGDDAVLGGNGADTLNGGLGADDITTGFGNDRVVFNTVLGGNNIDDVFDFNQFGNDTFVLENTGVGLFNALANGVLNALQFVVSDVALTVDQRIVYNDVTGNISYDADGSHSGAAITFAHVEAGSVLTANDFFVV